MIRSVELKDAQQIKAIYDYYILNTGVTFEEAVFDVSEMAQRILKIAKNYPWFVFEEDDIILGYAYAGPWKSRIGYIKTVESSIYLKHGASGKGIGSKLYSKLINTLKERGMHSVIGGVALPNDVSVALHKKFGFKKVAQFEDVGIKFDAWMDVTYWQLHLQK